MICIKNEKKLGSIYLGNRYILGTVKSSVDLKMAAPVVGPHVVRKVLLESGN